MPSLVIMTNSNNYPEFLIVSVDDESAANFASMNGFEEGTWYRVPSTLEDQPEAFRKENTPILSRSELAALSKEDYDANNLTGHHNARILIAQDLFSAARYASKRNWWLHAWKFVADPEVEDVVEYGFFCC